MEQISCQIFVSNVQTNISQVWFSYALLKGWIVAEKKIWQNGPSGFHRRFWRDVDEAKKVVRRAFELGINYFDTAKLDGDSEEKIGAALEDVRDECIIATKTASRMKRESLADIKSSLHRLKTNGLDLIQLHGIDDVKTLRKAMGPGGSLETCKEARSCSAKNGKKISYW